ncbi:hypothetical protein GJAV_G00039670 [Gymnothorax javanicus]|nr:hypothetical protein GJAV_G00039670 [Gymnothorax javanicus]
MEDCLHTSSENLSKLVSWAHSHGTICSLIPNLKHLLTEGAHGNLTAMWGCSAGHAYHWPLTATCKTGPKDRVCYQDSRSLGSDSLSLQAPGIPGDRFLARASKGKGPDCGQTRDSCDFSNCSEPSEVDDNTEDYNSNLFDIVCESSATDEDGDYELQNVPRTAPRKRGVPGTAQGDQWRQRTDETPGDPAVKKIKQEVPEDYYTVANTQLSGGMDLGPMSPSPKQATHRLPPLQTALVNKPSPIEGADLPAPSPSPSGKSTPSMAKPHRAPPPVAQGGPQLPGHSELADPMSGDGVGKPGGAPLPLRDTDDSPAGVSSDLEIVPAQTLGSDPKAEGSETMGRLTPAEKQKRYSMLHTRKSTACKPESPM